MNTHSKFTAPTLAAVTDYGSEIGLPADECEKFWFYYDANGWHVGKVKMLRWKSALAGWRLRWLERQYKPSNGDVLCIKNQTALGRVEERIKFLRGQFPLTQQKQKNEWNEMQAERKRLMQALDFKA